MTNPYADFVKSLTDEQLDNLYQLHVDDNPSLVEAVADEYESRERRTSLTFYTPHIDEFKRLLAEEEGEIKFAHTVIASLRNYRMAPGWSSELEAAFKTLIIELVEQIS